MSNYYCREKFQPSIIDIESRYRVEAVVLWIFIGILYGIGIHIFWKYRNHPNIKIRSPYLILISAISGFLSISCFLGEQWFRISWNNYIEYPVGIVPGYNMGMMALNYNVFIIGLLLPFPLRAFRLLFVFRKAAFHLKQRTIRKVPIVGIPEKNTTSARASRVLRDLNRKLFGRGPTESKFIAIFISVALVVAILAAITGQFCFQCQDIDPNPRTFIIYACIYGAIELVLAIALVLLRNLRDEFTINGELRMIILITLFFMVPWLGVSYTESIKQVRMALPPNYLIIVGEILYMVTSIYYPTIKLLRLNESIKETCAEIERTNSIGSTIDSILDNEIALTYFAKYLETELCSENLSFCEAVAFYKKKFNETDDLSVMTALAEAIEMQFVSNTGELQINISSEKVKHVHDILETEPRPTREQLFTLFDPLVMDIKYLMTIDSLPKFQQSGFFHEMCNALHDDTAKALAEAGLIEMTNTKK